MMKFNSGCNKVVFCEMLVALKGINLKSRYVVVLRTVVLYWQGSMILQFQHSYVNSKKVSFLDQTFTYQEIRRIEPIKKEQRWRK